MELNIENLGVVRQIKIDLSKKFILFCGRNSTGKTYTSFILQAFLSEGLVGNLDAINKFAQQINEKGCFRIEKSMIQEWIDVNCMNVKHKLGSIFGISDSTCNKLFQKFSISAQFTDLDFEKTLQPLYLSLLTTATRGRQCLILIHCVHQSYTVL